MFMLIYLKFQIFYIRISYKSHLLYFQQNHTLMNQAVPVYLDILYRTCTGYSCLPEFRSYTLSNTTR
jgi:hypothetical protein